MGTHLKAGVSLYGPTGGRKYLNAAERQRFIEAARQASPEVRLFCFVLRWSGGRISEVLALTPAAIDIESGIANIHTLKRRKRGIVRQVPLPSSLLSDLDCFFQASRTTKAIRNWPRDGSGDGAGQPHGGTSKR